METAGARFAGNLPFSAAPQSGSCAFGCASRGSPPWRILRILVILAVAMVIFK